MPVECVVAHPVVDDDQVSVALKVVCVRHCTRVDVLDKHGMLGGYFDSIVHSGRVEARVSLKAKACHDLPRYRPWERPFFLIKRDQIDRGWDFVVQDLFHQILELLGSVFELFHCFRMGCPVLFDLLDQVSVLLFFGLKILLFLLGTLDIGCNLLLFSL
jgi:hypothetical protein